MCVAAGVFAIAGESGWSLRLSVALLDLLLVPGLYACARILFPSRTVVALVAAFVGATLYWIVDLSRIGYPTQSLAVGVTLSAGALGLA